MKQITAGTAAREIRELLAAHSDSPQREAELLLERATGLSRTQQLLYNDQLLTPAQVEQLTAGCARRQRGEPLAYVLGECGFWTLQLTVTPAVLIPRPETELVVERALTHLPIDAARDVLDLGTGSGAIALAIASERPHCRITASDASAAALEVARGNIQRCRLANVTARVSNWFEQLPPQRYGLIVSNPPYIALNDPDLQPTVREYEPHPALFSGADGLEALRVIARAAMGFLEPNGWLVLEHGWRQAAQVRDLLESAGFSSVASHADLAGHPRVTEGQGRPGDAASLTTATSIP